MATFTAEAQRRSTATPEERQAWGREIARARREKGLSQEDLLRLAMAKGYSFSYITKIEVGQKGTEDTFNELMGLIRRVRKQREPAGGRR